MFLPFTITGNLIGKAKEKEWRKMMDLFQSFLHNIHLIKNMLKLQIKSKGVWQVTPTKHDWDHVDFVAKTVQIQNVLEMNCNSSGMVLLKI